MSYSDITKPASDLLGDDYSSKTTLKIKTKAGCVGVTNETERVASDDATSLMSKITLKWASPSGYLSVDKLTLKPNGSFGLETSLSNLAPNLKFTFAGSNKLDGKAGLEYKYNNFKTITNLDVVDFKNVESSSTVKLGDANVGASCNYKFKGGLDSFSMGGNYTTGDLFVSAKTSSDKDGSFTAVKDVQVNARYNVSNTLSLATQSLHSAVSPIGKMSAGFTLSNVNLPVINKSTVKAKITQKGVVNSCVSFKPAKGVAVVGNGEVSVKDLSTLKFGVGFTIG